MRRRRPCRAHHCGATERWKVGTGRHPRIPQTAAHRKNAVRREMLSHGGTFPSKELDKGWRTK